MSSTSYLPNRGDFVWVMLDPRVEHEQSGRRPAIVVSERLFTERTGLAIVCPITSKVKGLPFEIRVKSEKIDGAILPIHLRLVDIAARKMQFIGTATKPVIKTTLETVGLLVG